MQDIALEAMKTGENIFLTGSAGTGKSYVLKKYINYLRDNKIFPSIVALSGIAASHLKGKTIHSYFSLGRKSSVTQMQINDMIEKKYLKKRFSDLKVLIIDEISMVSPSILDSINNILKTFKKSTKPFGGIQIIVAGDFFQLPPVYKEAPLDNKRFAWQAESWREANFQTCYLQKKYRQEEQELINVLDAIRENNITQDTYKFLNSRINATLSSNIEPTRLFTHNINVDAINQNKLDELDSPSKFFVSSSTGKQKDVDRLFASFMIKNNLELKIGSIVMFTKNNNEKGYLNGTTGKIIAFQEDNGFPVVKTQSGMNIVAQNDTWKLENDMGKEIASVSQVPLKLAWAITVHKSQGMTLDAAKIDLSKTFEVGQGYVALSRVKSIEGLILEGYNERALEVDPLILSIDNRIKEASNRTKKKIEELIEFRIKNNIKVEPTFKATSTLVKKEDTVNYMITKGQIQYADSFTDLVEMSKWSASTLIKHIDQLIEEGEEFEYKNVSPSNEVIGLVATAKEALLERNDKTHFNDKNELKLKPIFEYLNESLEYDDIKLALIFQKFNKV